jgi:AcrR family transcriptional regulator
MVDGGTRAGELRADAARNRARVLDIARDQLDAGDTSLPMNAIARQAGVGVGTVYRHFPTRRSLLEALAEDSFTELVREAALAAADDDPAAGLERLLRHALRRQLTDLGLATVLASGDFECPATLRLGADLARSMGELLDKARAAGVVRPDIHADDLRRLMCGVEHAVRSGADDGDRAERYLAVLLAGLRAA